MGVQFEIISSSRDKIVLALKKDLFIHLRFTPRYTKVNALNLSILASAAYLERNEIEEFLFKTNTKENRHIRFTEAGNYESCFLFSDQGRIGPIEHSFTYVNTPTTDTQFFHYQTPDYLLFSIRGTEQKLKDALTDANAQLVPFDEGVGKVHKGFHKAFQSIREELNALVAPVQDKPVILCGHSLGGAVATLAATYIRKKYHRKVLLYTFGCPLVGDAAFAYHFSEVEPITHYRFVHHRDLVTLVPPPHSNLRVNLLHLALISPVFLIPATFDPFGKPYTHLGKMVFLRRLPGNAGFSVDVDRKTPAYLRIPEAIPVKEERPTWDTVLNWANVSIHDHLMKNGYVPILASDLKFAIDSYLKASTVTAGNSQKILDYLDEEIRTLQAERDQVEKELIAPITGIAVHDVTGTGGARGSKEPPAVRMHLVEEALRAKQMEFILQRDALVAMRTPGYTEGLLKNILDLPMTPALRREFEYQSVNIKY